MRNKAGAIIGIIVIVIVAIAGIIWAQKGSTPATTNTDRDSSRPSQPSTTAEDKTATSPTDTDQVAATISYTNSGFTPQQVTVKSGDTIRIKNDSDNALSFNSDDHPTHTKEAELNVGDVEPGQSKTFVVTKKGTWGYHNHENSNDTGSITVE